MNSLSAIDFNSDFAKSPYNLPKDRKQEILTDKLRELTQYHYENCEYYKKMIDCTGGEDVAPFLPVALFKELELVSVPASEIFKTMTSSGTTGQAVSKIFLDRNTANNQQKTLVKIVSSFTGQSRMPMLVIDCPSVIKDRKMFSARGAGILGFSMFGTDITYALNDDMSLNFDAVEKFVEKHEKAKIFLFGFTFMIWQHFYNGLIEARPKFHFGNAILIHGGGWKKLANSAVSKSDFKAKLRDACSIAEIHDYYGMVEQTGCIYMECECGYLHASNFSDVIVRRGRDFSVCDLGEPGIVQVVSMLPESYPGHSLLTEDEGVIIGEDDCPCGRKGKYFNIIGRLKNAEIRGCSDVA